jgi:hypothetical protein
MKYLPIYVFAFLALLLPYDKDIAFAILMCGLAYGAHKFLDWRAKDW